MHAGGLWRFHIWIIQPLSVDFKVIWSPPTNEVETKGSHLHIKQTLQKKKKKLQCDLVHPRHVNSRPTSYHLSLIPVTQHTSSWYLYPISTFHQERQFTKMFNAQHMKSTDSSDKHSVKVQTICQIPRLFITSSCERHCWYLDRWRHITSPDTSHLTSSQMDSQRNSWSSKSFYF